MVDRLSFGVIIAGAISLLWYHRAMIDTSIVPPIIDEYWVTISGRWIAEGLLPYRDFFQFHFPGALYLYAVAVAVLPDSMIAMRAVDSALALLLGLALFTWYRANGLGVAQSLGVAVFVAGPCFYLWPFITPHLPALLALAAGALLLMRSSSRPRVAWFFAGAFLFFAAWSVQTNAVVVAALFAGALLFGIETAERRAWVPWVFAGAGIPTAVWLVSLLANGQWEPFLKQAVLFVVSDGYRQAGGVNDVSFFALVSERVGREQRWAAKAVFGGGALACFVILWAAPVLAIWRSSAARRVLLLPAVLAPLVYSMGRTDAHHAYYLALPGLLVLGAPERGRVVNPFSRTLVLVVAAVGAFAFAYASIYHLVVSLDRGLQFRDDRREMAAVSALEELGVGRDEPVAVLPWAANLYWLGVPPGHRFPYVAPASEGYHGEREWQILREQMRAIGTRWVAIYPAHAADKFVSEGRLPAYLVGEDHTARLVGRNGPIELWHLD